MLSFIRVASSSPPSPPDVPGGFQNRRGGGSSSDPSSAFCAENLAPVGSPRVWKGGDDLDLSGFQQGFQETPIMEAQEPYLSL